MPYKASYLRQSDVQLSVARNVRVTPAYETFIASVGLKQSLNWASHDVKQSWMTRMRGLACLVLSLVLALAVSGPGEGGTSEQRDPVLIIAGQGHSSARGDDTASAVDHAHHQSYRDV
jgi:hypothetical protein